MAAAGGGVPDGAAPWGSPPRTPDFALIFCPKAILRAALAAMPPMLGGVHVLPTRAAARRRAKLAGRLGKERGHNYDAARVGMTRKGNRRMAEDARAEGYAEDWTEKVIGHGKEDYRKAVEALRAWSMFQLGWAEVDPATPIKPREPVVVVAQAVLPWTCNPLAVVYVDQTRRDFAFAHGTLGGHLLRGEERFAVRLEENGNVVYSVSAISCPGHILSRATYPVVRLLQRRFATDSVRAMERALRQ